MNRTRLIRRAVAEAAWAPSVHNTQPWRFAAAGQEICWHADPGRPSTPIRAGRGSQKTVNM